MVSEFHPSATSLSTKATQVQALQTAAVLLVIVVLVTAFWWPALFEGKSLIHGDSIVHGLPLVDLHSRALHGEASVLWSEDIYGGHPIFAEGQAGFAHPLNILIAAFVPPIYGHNLFHFVCMLLGAIGAFGLCRTLGASAFAAGFGALTFTFAGINVGAQQNLSIGGTLTWIPWTLWAFEVWFRRPDALRALLFGAACCLMLLAGYPQLFHGTVIYMAVSLLVMPFSPQQRALLVAGWQRYAGSGALAVLFCCGLAAVQLLPLLELVGYSHRNTGVGLLSLLPATSVQYLRGLLFTLTGLEPLKVAYFPAVGSTLACVAAALALMFVLRISLRAKGHLLAVAILLQLGFGAGSPLFALLYSNHLLPGLEFFRTMVAYLCVAAAGIGVLAALGLDALLRFLEAQAGALRSLRVVLPAGLFVALSAIVVVLLYAPGVPIANLYGISAAVIAAGLVVALRRAALLLPLAFGILALECVQLHLHEIGFSDAAVLAVPASSRALAADGQLDRFRLVDRTSRGGYAFINPRDPYQATAVRYVLEGYAPMTHLLAGVPGFQGATALPLQRRMLLDPVLTQELNGTSTTPVGQRLVDLLALRYLTTNVEPSLPAYKVRLHEPAWSTWIMENTAARPRFQTFTRHVPAATPEQALQLLQGPREDALVIEVDAAAKLPDTGTQPNDPTAIAWQVRHAGSTRYEIDIDAQRAGWFFLADANYPGWIATVDGEPAPVYSAQVLGKAVAVTPGKHRVAIRFESKSFQWGLWLTLFTLLVAAVIVARHVMFSINANRS
jgi:hypothetical protein